MTRPAGPASRPPGDLSWQDQANCLGVDPDLFFPERGASTREAKEVCASCVVRAECLEFALVNAEKFGIWGGLSERERRRVRRQRSRVERDVLLGRAGVEPVAPAPVVPIVPPVGLWCPRCGRPVDGVQVCVCGWRVLREVSEVGTMEGDSDAQACG